MNAGVLARTAWTLARRSVWHAGRPRGGAALAGLTLVFAAAGTLVFLALFGAAAEAGVPRAAAEALLAWAFTLAMLMLVLGDLHAVVAAATTDPDLDRLRAAPLTGAQILAWKLVTTLPRTTPPALAVALPATLAFALAWGGVPPAGAALALLLAWAIPLALGTLLALPLLALVPGARLREWLALLATLAFVAGWLANAFWLPRVSLGVPGGDGRVADALAAIPPPPAWWPATWAARAVAGAPARAAEATVACGLALLAAAAGSAWMATRLLGVVQARAAGPPARTSGARARPAPTLAAAFLRRDAALASRDWPVALDALAGLALWMLLPLAILPLAPLPPLVLARAMLIALSVSLGHDLAARALPLERDGLHWAHVSPVGAARWVRLRALGVGLAGAAVVAVALAGVGLALRLEPAAWLDAAVFGSASAATAMATGLALGARHGDPAWTDPRAMLGAGGRALSAVAMLAQSAVWLALAHRVPASGVSPGAAVTLLAAAGVFSAAMLALAAGVVERREPAPRGDGGAAV
jgi:hypothetical protein